MEEIKLEVFSQDSNYAVIKPPGRRFPGVVVQGDSFSTLVRMANNIAKLVTETRCDNEDLIENVEELNNALVGRALHYQSVLDRHGLELPYTRPFNDGDLVTISSDGNHS